MSSDLIHCATLVIVAWLVTLALRALPFVLFGGRDRALPPFVERLGAVVSPIVIAGLIVYSYYGLFRASYFDASRDWSFPFLAGALTVALQVWKGNALVSILSGTVLYMSLLAMAS